MLSRASHQRPGVTRRAVAGVSLLEVVVLIIITGIAAAGIFTLYGAISRQSLVTDEEQRGVLLIESCAEVLLASRALLTSSFTGSSTLASCPDANLALAQCECHNLTKGTANPFTPYQPVLTISRTPATTNDQCVSQSGTPACVTVGINTDPAISSAPVVIQMQAR